MHLQKRNAIINILLQQHKGADPRTMTAPIGNMLANHRSFCETCSVGDFYGCL